MLHSVVEYVLLSGNIIFIQIFADVFAFLLSVGVTILELYTAVLPIMPLH